MGTGAPLPDNRISCSGRDPPPPHNAPLIVDKNDGTITIQYGEASAVAVGAPVTPEGIALAALTQAVDTEIQRRRGLHKSFNISLEALRSENTELKMHNESLTKERDDFKIKYNK
ncbi:hypothetical protein OC834_007816 [Tilletia horrida]|nr:hypothetical protein OC834_007816 [Tilletia horrida]